ncbi:embryonic protein UVS.2-like [Branchiostoma lanceolatum]|uniref:embryonic protein UVS.2-like n=1 Tax=Branchiostoma lanceolatum TaxID=7740 RepID=UPI003453CAEE
MDIGRGFRPWDITLAIIITSVTGRTPTSAPGCEGYLTAPPEGNVTSPNHPNDYGNNENCEWTITVPEGGYVRLTFDSFIIETGYDVLTIYDGDSDNAPVLQSLTLFPDSPIISSSDQVFVRFTSDETVTAPGFKFSYTDTLTASCGGNLMAPPEGNVTSPNHPDDYDIDETCEWTITVPEGNTVNLQFSSFNLENGYDFLTIYDGGSDSATQLQR